MLSTRQQRTTRGGGGGGGGGGVGGMEGGGGIGSVMVEYHAPKIKGMNILGSSLQACKRKRPTPRRTHSLFNRSAEVLKGGGGKNKKEKKKKGREGKISPSLQRAVGKAQGVKQKTRTRHWSAEVNRQRQLCCFGGLCEEGAEGLRGGMVKRGEK